MTNEVILRYKNWDSSCAMKQIEEKFKRKVKYWRISYKQASGLDRLYMGLYSVLILVYLWWYFLVS